MRRLGWPAVLALLVPLGYAAWVSFTPGAFLTPPREVWSLRWYAAFANDARWSAALGRSVAVAAASAMLAIAVGLPLAVALVRHRFLGRGALAVAIAVPACLPPVVLAMGLLPSLFAVGLWGSLFGLILAHAVVVLPVVVWVLREHLQQADPTLELAARGLGASAWQAFRRVTLPMLKPALRAAAASAFVASLNESFVALFLATPATETLPALVWPQLRFSPTPLVAVAAVVNVLAALAAGWTLRRRNEL